MHGCCGDSHTQEGPEDPSILEPPREAARMHAPRRALVYGAVTGGASMPSDSTRLNPSISLVVSGIV